MKNNILSKNYKKIVIYDEETKKELAVSTDEEVKTASSNIIVKLQP